MDTKKFKMGWMIVAFDLPVTDKRQRREATGFRKFLLDDGYLMIQFSLYARSCVSFARQQTHLRRLEEHLPPEGSVRALFVTRSQWERAFVMHGSPLQEAGAEPIPEQMQLW
jgi:CRISPR-associated protein Cas2